MGMNETPELILRQALRIIQSPWASLIGLLLE